tara:strand:+ start:2880 stop:3419 length:540 start_codon:yes stop_codon:yes gene_type:complete
VKPTVIDNVISSAYQDYIENIFSMNFSWYFTPRISDDVSTDPNTGFSHLIFEDTTTYSNHFGILLPVFFEAFNKYKRGLKPEKLIRIRVGMFIQDQTKQPHLPHIDFINMKHTNMLYYVNDSDGPTKLYNQDKTKVIKEVHPKKGRVLFFDGSTYHASSCPKDHPSRIVINYNFSGTTF